MKLIVIETGAAEVVAAIIYGRTAKFGRSLTEWPGYRQGIWSMRVRKTRWAAVMVGLLPHRTRDRCLFQGINIPIIDAFG